MKYSQCAGGWKGPGRIVTAGSTREVMRFSPEYWQSVAPVGLEPGRSVGVPERVMPVIYLRRLVRRLVYRAIASKSRSLCQTGMRLSIAMAAMRQSVEERIV